jgi:4-carboxymuconolactone decarboxylase
MAQSRAPIPNLDDMDENQRFIYDQSVKFFGEPIGPRIALISSPLVAKAWGDLLAAIQGSELPRKYWELSILIVARYWSSQFEFWAHSKKAIAEGLSENIIEAIKNNIKPNFINTDENIVYEYCHDLIYKRTVSDTTYENLRQLIGGKQVVELTVLMGHYSSVAMTLVAHKVALPKNVSPPLPELT